MWLISLEDPTTCTLSGPAYSGPPDVTTITSHLLQASCTYSGPPDITPVMSHLLRTSGHHTCHITPTLDSLHLLWTSGCHTYHVTPTPDLLVSPPAYSGPPAHLSWSSKCVLLTQDLLQNLCIISWPVILHTLVDLPQPLPAVRIIY